MHTFDESVTPDAPAAVVLTPAQAAELEQGQLTALAVAKTLTICDLATEQAAGDALNRIGDLKKKIAQDFGPSISAAHNAHRMILAQQRAHLDKLVEPERILRAGLTKWLTEKRRRHEAAERIAREVREVAEAEARRQAEEAQLKTALEVEVIAGSEVAEKFLDEVPVVTAPLVADVPVEREATAEGIGGVEQWHWEVEDAEKIPREYLVPDEKAIGAMVRARKGAASIPGVRTWSTVEVRRTRIYR